MIPLVDLKTQYLNLKNEIDPAVLDCLHNSHFISGAKVAEFEKKFAAYCQTPHAVALNSGTSSLHLALLALDIGPGDEVITVAMTFVASIAAILYCGAKPVLVDIDPTTWNMNPKKIEAVITAKTKAILVVHLHGLMADMNEIVQIAKKYNLYLIEDAAQAHGAKYHGKPAGSIGDIGCFSFYPAKNLGACGEAGAIVTHNENYAEKIKLLRNWGQAKKYDHQMLGFNYRMAEIQAAVLTVKLRYLDAWVSARKVRARHYDHYFTKWNLPHPVSLPDQHAYHVYAIQTENRTLLRQKLLEEGIETGIHYPIPIHLQKGYAQLGYSEGDFPEAEKFAKKTLSLPMYPELRIEQIQFICETLETLLQEEACLN